MKYFFITASMVGGGTERVISILANHFAREGEDVTILMTANDKLDYTLDKNVKINLITSNTGKSVIKRINRIRVLRSLYTQNKDAVFYSFGTETNLFSILASLGKKVNLVLSERSDPNQCTFKLLRDSIYFFGAKFVFQTEQARQCFSKRIQDRGVVISNPLRDDIPDCYKGERKKTIVAVGRLIPVKNYPLLIRAFAMLHSEYPDYQLQIFGQGEELEKLQELTKQLDVQRDVCFCGFTENVLEQIKTAGMYVLSSDYEGVSNSLLEAMALGVPVIATDCPIGGATSLIQNGENGLLIPVGDENSLYESMKRYAKHIAFADKCGQNAAKVRNENETTRIAKLWKDCISG